MLKNTPHSFGSVAKTLHWLITILVGVMLLTGYFLGGPLFVIHKLLGLAVLLLMIARIIWRVANVSPVLPLHITRFETILAHSTQGLLYLSLLIMPLSGWALATAFGHAPVLGGWVLAFPGMQHHAAWGGTLVDIHNTLALVLMGLIGLHVLGAFKHFLIDRDGVLQRMLPRCCVRSKSS